MATSLALKQPEKLQLRMHQSLAGVIPGLLAENQEDFVSLVQALFMRNEPKLIPASIGTCTVRCSTQARSSDPIAVFGNDTCL
ncbi:hypothetical protein QM565_19960 [Geitlerinema splendidum]|nr:hypothetical protein [Geitlerinema splendidum]